MYETTLDVTESSKLLNFLNGSEPGVLYLYGPGGNGKSTLMKQIQSERPALFEKDTDHYQVVLHHDGEAPVALVCKLFKNIVMTNVLPVGVDDDHVVHFKKTYRAPSSLSVPVPIPSIT
jgi:hypothetical protein